MFQADDKIILILLFFEQISLQSHIFKGLLLECEIIEIIFESYDKDLFEM